MTDKAKNTLVDLFHMRRIIEYGIPIFNHKGEKMISASGPEEFPQCPASCFPNREERLMKTRTF